MPQYWKHLRPLSFIEGFLSLSKTLPTPPEDPLDMHTRQGRGREQDASRDYAPHPEKLSAQLAHERFDLGVRILCAQQ